MHDLFLLATLILLVLISGLWLLRAPKLKAAAQPEEPRSLDILSLGERRIIPESEHQIPRRLLDDNAMKVVYRLQDAGYESYLVGGCIRDLLLGQAPKDFDVATSAHPEQAVELFHRGRLIGRRFKLLHVRFGRELIEVATFRASHDSDDNEDGEHGRQAESGLILRDNVYGSIEEDALRRDFTVNALYYCVRDYSIHDFANGYPDLKNRQLRMIGDPEQRYREDPVRMLRAARFAAKLSFEIEEKTAEPIHRLAPLLARIAPARLFDEALKLLQTGHGAASFRQMQRFGLFVYLFPLTQQLLNDEHPQTEALIQQVLRNTDRRLEQGKSVTPAFMFAALLWYPLVERYHRILDEEDLPPLQALHEAANQILSKQVKSTAIPKRFSAPMREIWELQLRLPRYRGRRADQLLEHPRFRAAYDLVLLRESAGEDLDGLGQWWTEYQQANPVQRSELQHAPSPSYPTETRGDKPKRRRRRKPNRRPAATE
ncbi:polynucleotide adenylyltransferase PcnB [Nitrincola tapanii]|uniref:Poly(A) polymerase I n=1 Tax=Nitrincola tapanii TaxID=1708751 RepID=A0A5A9VZJ9_9GAMM|nr:polynucleotide adenylyltransferase PcnB [Nitrincola tapanii]KAA0873664.1 polynucleotide adenylyltransferase PcnB [Nitrincola tapanii]